MLADDDPVSLWIDQLRQGDDLAARSLCEHYFRRLYELAKHKLRLGTRAAYYEEDAAQSAFDSVCAGIIAGRFPELHDRDSLWRLLLVIPAQKISNRHRYDQQDRRDVRRNLSGSACTNSQADFAAGNVHIVSREPTPEFAVEFVDVCEKLFQAREDATQRAIATLKMEGYTDSEVADRLNCSRRTVAAADHDHQASMGTSGAGEWIVPGVTTICQTTSFVTWTPPARCSSNPCETWRRIRSNRGWK